MKIYIYNHPFHLVTLSPWPLLTSLSIFITMIGSIKMFNNNLFLLMIYGFMMIIMCSYQWWRDIIRESTFQGLHTKYIYKLLKMGMFLFIISELLFFISFFWAYFHSSLSPNIEIGMMWPPMNIQQFNPMKSNMLNTMILLSSGITITYSHYSILTNKMTKSVFNLLLTLILGFMFTLIQLYEYLNSSFSISDSIYGSLFFMTTGFHGLHVIIGSLFLLIMLIRMTMNQMSLFHHFGFEAASWYWHFVDIIWIIVYSMIYWWNY
uniref:cytochrome c oxidase subunit 3 n=1 Tax=Synergus nanlingensis TaxID=3135082 RepID=UPI0030FF12B4